MNYGIRAVLLMGFGTLVALIAVLGFSAFRRADRIESEIAAIHENYRQTASALNQTKEDIHKAGIAVRDYLLDPSPEVGPKYKQELSSTRNSVTHDLASLEHLISQDEEKVLERLARQIDGYWNSLVPVFEWKPQQKEILASPFLATKLIPQRNSILSVMHEIDDLSERTLKKEQAKINVSRKEFQAYLREMLGASILLALGVAGVSIFQVSALEHHSENQRQRAVNAEDELRRLSQQLVQAQEEERKTISRELHDEIGQMLTGLKMELGNLEEFRNSPGNEFREHLAETKAITEQTMRSVRDMAMGLRPSMLDDLGLEPALRWQAREFSRHSGVPVSINADGNLGHLSEALRTCIYRVVQESLTNCGRHAQASNVQITVLGKEGRINLTIEDDGKGFDPNGVGDRGLGLIGMEERVKKLGGTFLILSQTQKRLKGTVLKVELPYTTEVPT
ncbi:MAG TPA: histidine kinase [Acidobacteriota bacterium]|nr:histidine kinase [Acidobacteriota bacterium]